MTNYILRRLIYMIPTIFVVSIIAFVVIQLPPGDYVTSYVVRLEAEGGDVTEAQVQALKNRYGLDKPFYMQYIKWAGNMLQGDMGMSWNWNKPVKDLLIERLPYTLIISLLSLLFIYVMAIPIGVYSAVKQYSIGDYIFTTFGFLGLSIPNFLLALVLMFIFFKFFGVSIGGLFSAEYIDAPWTIGKLIDLFNHLWIPIVVVGTAGTAGMIRIMRGVLLDELGKESVNTARAKGIREIVVIVKHAVRVAINPLISQAAFQLPKIISGTAITSIVLGLPTTGPLLLGALLAQDMFLAGSFIFLLSILTVIGTFLSDLLLAWVDPRIIYN